jgi:uncharacterized membrane protein
MKMREGNVLVKSLGWFALGLGALQIAAPRLVSWLVGVKPDRMSKRTMRAMGAREALSGAGLLAHRKLPGWLGVRVAGDAADIGLLAGSLLANRVKGGRMWGLARVRSRLGLALGAVLGVTALDVLGLRYVLRALKGRGGAEPPELKASTTIERGAEEVYRFLRDVTNYPRFVSFLTDVTTLDDKRSHWIARFPDAKEVTWNTVLAEEVPERLLILTIDSRLLDTLTLRLVPAPGGRGTEVHVSLSARNSRFPAAVSRWLRRIPERLLSSELRRMKQVIELGEVSQSDATVSVGKHPARPEHSI